MFPACSLQEARSRLDTAIGDRLVAEWVEQKGFTLEPMQLRFDVARFPVGLLFLRGDRAGPGKDLAEQVAASFGYWNLDSSKYFDVIFPGWGEDGVVFFNPETFLAFRDEVQKISRWKYSGQTDLLLLNYEYDLKEQKGDFSFAHTVTLPVEVMIDDGRVRNLDALMHDLVAQAREIWTIGKESRIWEISDRIGITRGWRALWKWVNEHLLWDLKKIYDEMRPFAVCDLRLKQEMP